MPLVELIIHGEPKGQPRPRAFARKMGNGKYAARVYDAGTAENWKSLIAIEVKAAGLVGAMWEGPVSLTLHCQFQRPKTHFRSGKNAHILKDEAPRHWHLKKPDMDNLVKAVKDTLTQCGVWHDDSQVCRERLKKTWGDQNRTVITITQIPDEP